MTQDPYGRPPGGGSVVQGEVVPDDETQPNGPMTHFQKVASALRGDRTDPAAPDSAVSDSAASAASDPDAAPTGPQVPDPNGTWPRAAVQDDAAADDVDADTTGPEDVVAVRSPDTENRDYWDEADADERDPEALTTVPAAEPVMPTAEPVVSTAEPVVSSAEPVADAADPTVTQPDIYAAGTTAEPEVVGKHASDPVPEAAPVQGGLRPGESDQALGDFSDLTFGSLLPDAAEYKTQWQQVQFRFVDDPTGSVTEAADVVAQLTAKLEAAIQERQRAIAERQRTLRDRWSEGKSTDTESLRETLLMYRAFLDQLTGPNMS
jgi:hypothetical protein